MISLSYILIAGDHVKFGFPMAWTVSTLAWGLVEFKDAYESSGEYQNMLNSIRVPLDYFIKAHPQDNLFYGQVWNTYIHNTRMLKNLLWVHFVRSILCLLNIQCWPVKILDNLIYNIGRPFNWLTSRITKRLYSYNRHMIRNIVYCARFILWK